MRIGIVGGRAELSSLVAAVVAASGSRVPLVALSTGEVAARHDCDLVIVDPVAGPAPGAERTQLVPRVSDGRVVVAFLAGEEDAARATARQWGANAVVELPRAGRWLAELVGSTPPMPGPTVLAVVGATGGCGTSTLAVAAALAAARDSGDCLLVDADPWSAGLDLGLGVPEGAGARWTDVPADADALVADTLRACLPRMAGIYVLTGEPRSPRDPRVTAALRAGREDFAHTVVDSGREPGVEGRAVGDALLIVVPCTLAGVVGGRRLLSCVQGERVAVALRPTGWMPSDEVAGVLGCPRVLTVPRLRTLPERAECGELTVGRTGRSLATVGAHVWAALR